MSSFQIDCEWTSALASELPEVRATAARIRIDVAGFNLTLAENSWSQTLVPAVLLSAYPLALWLASSWWRLLYEPRIPELARSTSAVTEDRARSVSDWRMSHEVAAAGGGFIWPNLAIAGDGSAVQLWSPNAIKSPCLLESLTYTRRISPHSIPIAEFKAVAGSFIDLTIARLQQQGIPQSDLERLWGLIREDEVSAEAKEERVVEAALGYDPEDCPVDILEGALNVSRKFGLPNFFEIAPLVSREGSNDFEAVLREFPRIVVTGYPSIPASVYAYARAEFPSLVPWERGVALAQVMRSEVMPDKQKKIQNSKIFDLLGVSPDYFKTAPAFGVLDASVGIKQEDGGLKIIPRKKHGTALRFEYARLIGDCVLGAVDFDSNGFVATTDLMTTRQKMQRAFAAEFLCPISKLVDSMHDDFSESARQKAALLFGVNEKTVDFQLMNNRYLDPEAFESQAMLKAS